MSTMSHVVEEMDREALEALYEETFKNFEEGTITEGRVVVIQKERVIVDIGYKSEGIISATSYPDELTGLAVGDRIQVYIEQREDAEGNLLLSKEKADKMKIWDELEVAHQEEREVHGKVVSRIKGGMMVDIGVKAFLPGSQIDLTPVRDLDSHRSEKPSRLKSLKTQFIRRATWSFPVGPYWKKRGTSGGKARYRPSPKDNCSKGP